MSEAIRTDKKFKPVSLIQVENVLNASKAGLIGSPVKKTRRSRRKTKRAITKGGLIAPLLAAEGC